MIKIAPTWYCSVALACALLNLCGMASVLAQDAPAWVQRSNDNTQVLLDVTAKLSPEGAARFGVDGLDEEIFDLSPGFRDRYDRALEEARAELRARLDNEEKGPVEQDLRILLADIDESLEGNRLRRTRFLPWHNVAGTVYGGLRSLLEDRIPAERRAAALVRLRRYAGREAGYEPLAELAASDLRTEWSDPSGRLAPSHAEVERDLSTSGRYLDEISTLFDQYGLAGYEADYQALREQVTAYDAFVREEILPRTRADFHLPEDVYAFGLKAYGIDMPVDELRRRASVAFEELQDQMQALAIQIAVARGLDSDDYRDVLRALKEEQFEGEAILPFYEQRMRDIEAIVEREGIVTLPERGMTIRLATEAESAQAPAPFMSPPRLIGNTGEFGEFVLPLRLAGGAEGSVMAIDDFTFEAASWPLAVHEGRPGHELQFTAMIERGVSLARVLYARNSVNSEGWALYMEEQMYPYLPLEGQFTTLWSRGVRAARAFLDPGLHSGAISREDAERFLRDEVVVSEALVRSELERYTFRGPGQATSYFVGYLRLMELRAEVELLLGERFDRMAFHDFILAQGLLPPSLLRQAVMDSFVPPYSSQQPNR